MEKLVLTMGSGMSFSVPVLDAQNHGPACFVVGPGQRRNSWRFYAVMPKKNQIDKIRVPPGLDPSSIRFSPHSLVVVEPFAKNLRAKILRILSPQGVFQATSKDVQSWKPDTTTSFYPCAPMRGPQLNPGEIIEIEGASWVNSAGKTIDRRKRLREQGGLVADCKTFIPTQMMLMVEYSFLARHVEYTTEWSAGSPLEARQPFLVGQMDEMRSVSNTSAPAEARTGLAGTHPGADEEVDFESNTANLSRGLESQDFSRVPRRIVPPPDVKQEPKIPSPPAWRRTFTSGPLSMGPRAQPSNPIPQPVPTRTSPRPAAPPPSPASPQAPTSAWALRWAEQRREQGAEISPAWSGVTPEQEAKSAPKGAWGAGANRARGNLQEAPRDTAQEAVQEEGPPDGAWAGPRKGPGAIKK